MTPPTAPAPKSTPEPASRAVCMDCGSSNVKVILPHGRLCQRCRQRRHYYPRPCPGCSQTRPLAWVGSDGPASGLEVCADCAGAVSVFSCKECGSEEHPYSYTRCARCHVRELLTEILTDPATGTVHHRLVPVFDLLTSSRRPQTTYWWLTRPGAVAPTSCPAWPAGHSRSATTPSASSSRWTVATTTCATC